MGNDFHIGQKFVENYQPEAALWANEHDAYIKEVSINEEGKSIFELRPVSEIVLPESLTFNLLRTERNKRLSNTDFYLMPDYNISDDNKLLIMEYRQALRDLPAQEGAPWDGGGDGTPWPEFPTLNKP